MAPLDLLLAFLKYIFGIEVWQIPFGFKSQLDRQIFSIYFSSYEKFVIFCGTFTPYYQTLFFRGTVMYVQYDFL
jgi:hypothetical protein